MALLAPPLLKDINVFTGKVSRPILKLHLLGHLVRSPLCVEQAKD